MLLIAPALDIIVSGWRRQEPLILPLLAGVSPVVLWHLFSLCYYGFLLRTHAVSSASMRRSRCCGGWAGTCRSTRAGSDHACRLRGSHCRVVHEPADVSGRPGRDVLSAASYPSAPTFSGSVPRSAVSRVRHDPYPPLAALDRGHPPGVWIALTAAAVACSIVVPNSPLRAIREGPRAPDVDYYYPASGWPGGRPARTVRPFLQIDSLADCQRRRVTAPTVAVGADGLNGFCRGPLASLIDPHGMRTR